MKIYDSPKIRFVLIEQKDIVTLSANSGDNVASYPDDGVWNED